ncbi:hypothetical protein Tsp_15588 [Trichinella spiralis]|uniref:hypothetical protein n=1 Tax=Trichinella spiralis TaxID=6334 RepID=UPI0001EFEDCF|nr:hypothetical protein Tsp_15588 [Trichinella spiralis]
MSVAPSELFGTNGKRCGKAGKNGRLRQRWCGGIFVFAWNATLLFLGIESKTASRTSVHGNGCERKFTGRPVANRHGYSIAQNQRYSKFVRRVARRDDRQRVPVVSKFTGPWSSIAGEMVDQQC